MPSVLYGQAEARRHGGSRRALRAPLRPPDHQEVTGPIPSQEDLLRAKLRALVGRQWGPEAVAAGEHTPYPSGAGLRPCSAGGPAYLLIDRPTERSLGGALAWALRHHAGELDLLLGAGAETAGIVARRAEPFALPVRVWRVGPTGPLAVDPAPFPAAPALAAEDVPFIEVLRGAGIEPVVEHGVLSGEVLGLEVARAVGGRLEVGVGAQDRLARLTVWPDADPLRQLEEVVALVRRFRTLAASAHLANHLARERWLRAVLLARPDLVGAAWLAPLPPAVRRADLQTPAAALAAGVDAAGAVDRPVVVAASTGIDLDAVPAAADGRRAAGLESARLVVAVPEGDDHPRTRQLAALLRPAAEVVTVPAGWKDLAGTL